MFKLRLTIRMLLLLLLVAMLSGCWDRREIEERTSVVAIGLDLVEDQPEMLAVSVQIPVPLKIASSSGGDGGGDSKEAVIVMEAQGRTVLEAIQELQNRLNQKIFFGQTRILAFGEGLARQGMRTIIDPFRRDPEIRRLLWPIVVKGRASELLRSRPNLEQIPSVYIMTMFENGTKMGTIPDMNLGNFFIDLSTEGREPFLNYLEVSESDLVWNGVALFRGDRMVGTLGAEDTWQMLRIDDEMDGGDLVFAYEGKQDQLITIGTELIRSRKSVQLEDDVVKVKYEVHLEGNLLEKTFGKDLFTAEDIRKIERDANKFLEEKAKEMIRKLQQSRSDALGLGKEIHAFYPKIWKKINWVEAFPNAEIIVSYHFELRNTGMEME